MKGQLIADPVAPPPQPSVPAQTGSNIQASAGVLAEKNSVMEDAVKNLGGGRRRSRRSRRRFRGGAVEVKAVPRFVSAGGVDPKQSYADLLETAHIAKADGAYDGLGQATPMNANATGNKSGGRRRKRSGKHNGSKRATLLRSRRTRRRSRGLRSSRR